MLSPSPQIPSSELSELNDRDLLRRFSQDADEAAFAEIVVRHQALVMGVCRRVMGNSPDVEDAFQATFITLARRPRRIRKAASLSSWLYTVAWRICVRLMRQRREHAVESLNECPAESSPDPLEQIASDQDGVVLDEELNQLPEKYREVLVMTYFSGYSSQQIADQLGISKGAVDGRIRQARNMLRVRLVRRGVGISVLTAAAALCSGGSATASPALLDTTIQLGAQTLSGSLPGTTDLSHLEPFIRPEMTMISSKLMLSAVLCATAVIGIAGMRSADSGQDNENSSTAEQNLQSTVPASDAELQPVETAADFVLAETAEELVLADATVVKADAAGGAGRPRFSEFPADATPVEQWMYQVLDRPVPLLDFPGETPLSEVLDLIQSYCTEEYGAAALDGSRDARLTIWPDNAELSLEGIVSLEDVTVRDISLNGVTLRHALDLVFEQTSEPELTYVIDKEVMKITTVAKAESNDLMRTQVYDVEGLLNQDFGPRRGSRPSPFSVSPGSQVPQGSAPPSGADAAEMSPKVRTASSVPDLTTVVMEMTPDESWSELGGEGTICIVGSKLVVRQTPAVHREVVRLLNLLADSDHGAQ